MTETRKLRVFLCHSSQDKPIVRELYQRLSAEGWIDPWLDEEKLLPGQDWDMEIEKAVEAADAVIVCLSNNSVTKEGYVQRELKFVLDIALEKTEGMIFLIPLRLDSCELPRRLRAWQYVDYFPVNQKPLAYDKLLKSLKMRVDNFAVSNDQTRASLSPILQKEDSSTGISFNLTSKPKDDSSISLIISRGLFVGIVFSLISMFFLGSLWILLTTFVAGVVSNLYVGGVITSNTRLQSALKGGIAGGISGIVIFFVSILYEYFVMGETASFSLSLVVFVVVAVTAMIGGAISGYFYVGRNNR